MDRRESMALEAPAEVEAGMVGHFRIQPAQAIDSDRHRRLVGFQSLGNHRMSDSHHVGCLDVILDDRDSTRQISCRSTCPFRGRRRGEAGQIGHSTVLAGHGPRLPSNCPLPTTNPMFDRMKKIGHEDACE